MHMHKIAYDIHIPVGDSDLICVVGGRRFLTSLDIDMVAFL